LLGSSRCGLGQCSVARFNRTMKITNVFNGDTSGGRIGASTDDTSVFVYEIAPGGASCPYHYEYNEEWLLVVDGTVSVRTPDGELSLERGDLVCFPAGPAGAHKIMNRSDAPARTMLFSQASSPSVAVYPDSGKIGVFPGLDGRDRGFFRHGDAVEWSYGEEGWNRAD
jgi:uncharacterized cupin superfamily protein